jgi:predicted nucleic acid-binding Zn ribbon protein
MPSLPALRTHCPACGRALNAHEQFAGEFCADWQCRRRRMEAEQRRLLARQMAVMRDDAAAAAGDTGLRTAPVVTVRWYETDLEPVPDHQREQLRSHLRSLEPDVHALAQHLAAAEPHPDPQLDPTPNPEVDALLGQVCARCTGYCCRLGYSRMAFLDAPAMLASWQADPTAAYEELVDGYLAALPALHHAGSCGFHGAAGCVLPRGRRAAICNSFECPGLEATRAAAEQHGVRRVFVVRHDAEHVPVGAFAPPP